MGKVRDFLPVSILNLFDSLIDEHVGVTILFFKAKLFTSSVIVRQSSIVTAVYIPREWNAMGKFTDDTIL